MTKCRACRYVVRFENDREEEYSESEIDDIVYDEDFDCKLIVMSLAKRIAAREERKKMERGLDESVEGHRSKSGSPECAERKQAIKTNESLDNDRSECASNLPSDRAYHSCATPVSVSSSSEAIKFQHTVQDA